MAATVATTPRARRARRYGAAVPTADRSGPTSGLPTWSSSMTTARRWCSTPPRRATLLALTGGLEAATVSACPTCRSRILAVVALVDLLDDAPPFARSGALLELADDAPTLHLYVRDLAATVRVTARGATRARRSGPT